MGTNTIPATRVMTAARRLVRALSGSARAVEGSTGISGAQLFLLRTLANSSAAISINELGEQTLTHQSTVSGVVSRLVERKLVRRTRATDDARRSDVAITARGRALLKAAPPTVQTQLVNGLAHMTATQRETLANALEIWLAAAGLANESAGMFHEIEDSADTGVDTGDSARRRGS